MVRSGESGPAALLRDVQRQLRIAEAHVRDSDAKAGDERRARLMAEDRADGAERQVVALRALVETLSERIEALEAERSTPLERES